MQAVFVSWYKGEIVKIDVLQSVGGVDLNATAVALMAEYWNNGVQHIDFTQIFLAYDGKLILGGEENGAFENGLRQIRS